MYKVLEAIIINNFNLGAFIVELTILIFVVYCVRKYRISAERIGVYGLILLAITMIFSILRLDDIAGVLGGFVWLLFVTSFVMGFYRLFFEKQSKKNLEK